MAARHTAKPNQVPSRAQAPPSYERVEPSKVSTLASTLNKKNGSLDADKVRLTGSSSSNELYSEPTKFCFNRGPECNAADPFYTLPIGEAGQIQFLLYHCKF